jgi:hypothetical protein
MNGFELLGILRRRANRLGIAHREREAKSSHVIVWHGDKSTTVPCHRKELADGTFHKILKQLGLNKSDLQE